MAPIDLSVVIPVFRSESTLGPLFERLTAVLDATGLSYEIVFVDDGSPDSSWDVLCSLRARCSDRVVAIQLMRNFGQHNALMCGFAHCRGRYIITMDDDLQNPPEEIPKLLDAIREGDFDVVYGQYQKKKHHRGRNLGSKVVNAFFRIVFHSRATITSFRIIRRDVIESILSYDLNFTLIDGLLAWNTRRVGTVPVEHHPRQEGTSGYSLGKLLALALNLFTTFSLLPLQAASFVGLLAAVGGFTLGAYYLLQYFIGNIAVPGYASTITAIFVLGGLQLLSLGIIGEYLGRLHLNVNHKPQYTIRSVARPEEVPGETTGSNDRIE